MQSLANVGNRPPVFHLRATRCLGIAQLLVGITLAMLAGFAFSFTFTYYDEAYLSGIFGSILATFTLVCRVCSFILVTVPSSCCGTSFYLRNWFIRN